MFHLSSALWPPISRGAVRERSSAPIPKPRSFTGADRVFILDVYSAGEDNIPGVQGSDLAHQIPNAMYVGDFKTARESLEELVGPDDVVLMMGAGDIKKLGDELAHKI